MRAKTILTVLFLISLAVAVIVVLRAMPTQVDANANTPKEETVTVYGKPGVQEVFALFRRQHDKGAQVISRGNPGPWLNYSPRNDPAVVPFFAMID